MGVYIPNMSKPKECDGIGINIHFTDGHMELHILDECELIEIDDTVWENEKYKLIRMTEEQRINKKLAEVVRCGECKWCDNKGKGRALICTNPYIDMDIHPLDFCSYGERRNDDNTIKADK